MKESRLLRDRRNRGGVTLSICLILLPLSLAGALIVFQSLEIAVRETDRRELTVQSRMLVDSAITLAQSGEGSKPWDINGQIVGVGRFEIQRVTATGANSTSSGPIRLIARGEHGPQMIGSTSFNIITTLELEWDEGTKELRIDSGSERTEYRVETERTVP